MQPTGLVAVAAVSESARVATTSESHAAAAVSGVAFGVLLSATGWWGGFGAANWVDALGHRQPAQFPPALGFFLLTVACAALLVRGFSGGARVLYLLLTMVLGLPGTLFGAALFALAALYSNKGAPSP